MIGPTLPTVENAQDFDTVAINTIWQQIRCPADNELARSLAATWSSYIWKLQ